MLLQEFLLKEALKEHGIDQVKLKLDHKNGRSAIRNKVEKFSLGIKYPKYYLNNIAKLDHTKKYDYCFIGSTTDGLGRSEIIERYYQYNSKLGHSSNGRDVNIKFGFDKNYYQIMANSKFGLAPGHPQMPKHPNRWTYRFIEAAFCRAIPVHFKETIYGESFIKDIFYVWDHNVPCVVDNHKEIVEENYKKAVEYWTLQPEEVKKIKELLKLS